jgi:HSP20 family protein
MFLFLHHVQVKQTKNNFLPWPLQKQIVWQKRKYAFYAKRYNEGSIMGIIESAAKDLARELDRRSREFYESVLPSIDMYEDGNDLVIEVDLPGFAKKNIFLRVTDDVLSIKARKKEARRDEEYPGIVHYRQRPVQIDRRIILPFSTREGEGDRAVGTATYADGVVKLNIPIPGSNVVPIA